MRDLQTMPAHQNADDVLALALRPPLPAPADARRVLKDRGILASELAAAIGVSEQSVSNWLNDRNTPTGRNRENYAAAIRLIAAGGIDLAGIYAPEPEDTDPMAQAARAAWALEEALEALATEDLREPSAAIVAEHLEQLAAKLRAAIEEAARA